MRFKLATYKPEQSERQTYMYPSNFLRKVLSGKYIIRCAHIRRIDNNPVVKNVLSGGRSHIKVMETIKNYYE